MFKSASPSYDFDLFVFTNNIRIHIASGGAKIPKYLINLTRNNPRIYNYFSQPEFINSEIGTNTKLEEIIFLPELQKSETFSREFYLETFNKFARQGFYSFDKTDISDPNDKKFHLVSFPLNKNDNREKSEPFIRSDENLFLLNRNGILIETLLEEINNKTFDTKILSY